jgi:hypothetical protein
MGTISRTGRVGKFCACAALAAKTALAPIRAARREKLMGGPPAWKLEG